MDSRLILSLLLLITGMIYFISGVITLHTNSKSLVNRVFFYVNTLLFVWSFCNHRMLISYNDNEILLLDTIGKISFACVYAAVIIYFIDVSGIIKEKYAGLRYLVFLPIIYFIYASVNRMITLKDVKLVFTDQGFLQSMNFSHSYIYFLCYVILYSVTVIVLALISFKKRKEESYGIKMFGIVLGLLLLSAHSIAFYVRPHILRKSNLPYIIIMTSLPVIMSVAIAAHIFISARKNENDYSMIRNLFIINNYQRSKIFMFVAYVTIVLTVMNYGINSIFPNNIDTKVLNLVTVYCLITAAIVIFLQKFDKSMHVSENVSSILVTILIPIVFLGYSLDAVTTIWALPFVIILIGLVFTRKTFIILCGMAGIVSYIVLVLVNADYMVAVKTSDHILRLLLYSVSLISSIYVHNIYIGRLKQMQKHEVFQQTMFQISQWLILSKGKNVDITVKMRSVLKTIANFANADRVFAYNISGDNLTILGDYGMSKLEHEKLPQVVQIFKLSDKFRKLLKKNIITFSEENSDEYQFFKGNSIASIYIPMINDEEVIGILVLQYYDKFDEEESNYELLRTFANIIAGALTRNKMDTVINDISNYDILTKLPNRRNFIEITNNMISKQEDNPDNKMALALLDLDSFQKINDLKGHDYGDRIIVEIARRLKYILGPNNVLSRFGGDEFLILFPTIDSKQHLLKFMTDLTNTVKKPFIVDDDDEPIHITFSCGICIFPDDGKTVMELIKNADIAMNEAKANGKDKFIFFAKKMVEGIEAKEKILNGIMKAEDNNELELYYQPQVDAVTHEIVGAEALIRWTSPVFGPVSPAQFIPVVEESGLINSIGNFVIKTALNQLHEMCKLGFNDITVAINLSIVQMKKPEILDYIQSLADKYGINNWLIDIEITEGAYADNNEQIRNILNEFANRGYSISIDDFGTGYSSLSRLKFTPFDKLKIDMSYVRGIGNSKKDEGIVITIINLAKSLGVKTVAEGVETEEQLRFLVEQGCDYIQGYYFYKPMNSEDFMKLLLEKK